jgi:hypothetical protein
MPPDARETRLRLVRSPVPLRGPGAAWSDVLLLAFIIGLHAPPLVALAAGRSWGVAVEGYATAVVFVTGVELCHELRERGRSSPGPEERRS